MTNIQTFKQFIEKRSHPELNPKLSAYELLKPYSDKENYYISFTEKDKLGINPNAEAVSTPLGIYTYPLKETWKEYEIDDNKDFSNYPYGNKRHYIWLIKPKSSAKTIDVSQYTEKDLLRDLEALALKFERKEIDMLNDKYYNKYSNDKYVDFLVYWNVTLELANNNVAKWNKLLSLGYDVISDKNGTGCIHHNEPMQTLFLNIKSFAVVKEIYNKDYQKIDKENLVHIKSTEDVIQYITLQDILTNTNLYRPISVNNKCVLLNNSQIYLDTSFNFLLVKYIEKHTSYIESNILNITHKLKYEYPFDIFILLCLFLLDLYKYKNIKQFIIDNTHNINHKILSTYYVDSILSYYNFDFKKDIYLKNIDLITTKDDNNIEKIKLLDKYKRKIFKKTDILNLSIEERTEIKSVFKSEFLFLNELEKYQANEDDVLF